MVVEESRDERHLTLAYHTTCANYMHCSKHSSFLSHFFCFLILSFTNFEENYLIFMNNRYFFHFDDFHLNKYRTPSVDWVLPTWISCKTTHGTNLCRAVELRQNFCRELSDIVSSSHSNCFRKMASAPDGPSSSKEADRRNRVITLRCFIA